MKGEKKGSRTELKVLYSVCKVLWYQSTRTFREPVCPDLTTRPTSWRDSARAHDTRGTQVILRKIDSPQTLNSGTTLCDDSESDTYTSPPDTTTPVQTHPVCPPPYHGCGGRSCRSLTAKEFTYFLRIFNHSKYPATYGFTGSLGTFHESESLCGGVWVGCRCHFFRVLVPTTPAPRRPRGRRPRPSRLANRVRPPTTTRSRADAAGGRRERVDLVPKTEETGADPVSGERLFSSGSPPPAPHVTYSPRREDLSVN